VFNVWSVYGSIGLDPSEAKRGLQESEDAARKSSRTMEAEVARATTSIEKRLATVGTAFTRLGAQMSLRVTAPIAAFAAVTLKAAGDFEASMNRVGAITQATGDQFEQLESLAKNLGATTAYSASQAAEAMSFLAMAGFDVDEVLAALPGTLKLASAGQLDLATAADIASNVLTGFGLAAAEINRVNDVLAQTSISANTNVAMLGEAFKYVAPVAAGLGVSVEEAGAAIGLLSNAGIQASSAGTGLRQVLSTLVLKADEVGVSARDSAGNMRPLADILGDLERKGYSAEQALETFGMRGGPALTALLSQGSDALRTLTDDLENAGGTAERLADAQMQGLSGALKNLRSAMEAVSLAIAGSGLLEFATNLTERVTVFIRKIADLNPAALRTGTIIAGIAAAIGPLLIAIGSFIKLAGVAIVAVKGIGVALAVLSGPVGVIAGVVVGVGLLAGWLKGRRDSLHQKLTETMDTTREFARSLADADDEASLRRAVHSAANELETTGRAAFIQYAEEAIATGGTLQEVAQLIAEEWAKTVNAADIARLEMKRIGLQAQVDAFETRLAVRRTLMTDAMNEIADLERGYRDAVAAGNRALADVYQERIRQARQSFGMHASEAELEALRGIDRVKAEIAEIGAQLDVLTGKSWRVAVNAELTHTPAGDSEPRPGLPDIVDDLTGGKGKVDVPVEIAFAEGSLGRLHEELAEARDRLMRATTETAQAIAINTVNALEATIRALEERIAALYELAEHGGPPIPRPPVAVTVGTWRFPDWGADRELPPAPASSGWPRPPAVAPTPPLPEAFVTRPSAGTLPTLGSLPPPDAGDGMPFGMIGPYLDAIGPSKGVTGSFLPFGPLRAIPQPTPAVDVGIYRYPDWGADREIPSAPGTPGMRPLRPEPTLPPAGFDRTIPQPTVGVGIDDSEWYRATAEAAASAAEAVTRLMERKAQLGDVTTNAILPALEDERAALEAAMSVTDEGSDAWDKHAARLVTVTKRIDELTPATLTAEEAALAAASANVEYQRALAALGDESADVKGALTEQLTAMEASISGLEEGTSAWNDMAHAIAEVRGELDRIEPRFGEIATTIVNALAGQAVPALTKLGEVFGMLAAGAFDSGRGVAFAMAQMAVGVMQSVAQAVGALMAQAIAQKILYGITLPFTTVQFVAAGAAIIALGGIAAWLRSKGARVDAPPTGATGGDDGFGEPDNRTREQLMEENERRQEQADRERARATPQRYATFEEYLRAGWTDREQARLNPAALLLLEQRYWQGKWDAARTDAAYEEANVALRRVQEAITRLQQLGLDEDDRDGLLNTLMEQQRKLQEELLTAETEARIAELNAQLETVAAEIDRLRNLRLGEDAPAEWHENLQPVSFGGTPHATQLAVATPLLDASRMMFDAAQLMRDTFASLLPSSPTAGFSALPPFTSAIERMTPVLERLLADGVSISVASGATGTATGASTAHLRGI